jgi:hypothetical protein
MLGDLMPWHVGSQRLSGRSPWLLDPLGSCSTPGDLQI